MINFPSWSRNAHRGKLNPMPGADGIFISPILSTAFFLQQLPHFPSVAFSFNQLLSVCTPRPSVLLSYQSQGFFNLIDAPQSPGGFKARHKAAITQPLFPRRGKKKNQEVFRKKVVRWLFGGKDSSVTSNLMDWVSWRRVNSCSSC